VSFLSIPFIPTGRRILFFSPFGAYRENVFNTHLLLCSGRGAAGRLGTAKGITLNCLCDLFNNRIIFGLQKGVESLFDQQAVNRDGWLLCVGVSALAHQWSMKRWQVTPLQASREWLGEYGIEGRRQDSRWCSEVECDMIIHRIFHRCYNWVLFSVEERCWIFSSLHICSNGERDFLCLGIRKDE